MLYVGCERFPGYTSVRNSLDFRLFRFLHDYYGDLLDEMFPQFPDHFQVFLHVSPSVSTICFPRFKWKQFPYRYIPELSTFYLSTFMGLNIKEGRRQRQGALISNHCLISHRWYDVEKLTVSGSSNLKAQHKVFC